MAHSYFADLLACYRTGQMSERQWIEHLKDRDFVAWLTDNHASET